MRIIDIFTTASANMLRNKMRTSLTIIAIFIGALTLSLTNGIGAGVSSYIDTQLGNVGAEDALIVEAKVDFGFGGGQDGPPKYNPDRIVNGSSGIPITLLDDNDIEIVKAQEGILKVEPLILPFVEYIESATSEKYQLSIGPYIEGTRLDLAAGEPINLESFGYEIILPLAYVDALGFSSPESAIGGRVTIGIKNALNEIEAVYAKIIAVQQESLLGSAGATVNKSLAEELFAIQTDGLPEVAKTQYANLIAKLSPTITDEQLQKLKDALDQEGYLALTVEDRIGVVKQVIGAITMVLNVFAAIALLAASFGIVNTLLMAVQERTKEIGLMKAMGMSSSKIFLLFSTEAVLLGFWGSFLGIAVAQVIGIIANQIATETFLKNLPGFTLLSFPLQSMVVIILIIMGVAFLAGTLPARRAAKQNPIDALRYE